MGKKRGNKNGNQSGKRENRGYWKEIERKNDQWERYYKAQGLIPEEEFDQFKKTCEQDLPLTFRITGFKKHAHEICDLFTTKHMPNLQNADDETSKPPFPFPWYPGQLGYQIDLPKSVVKKNPLYASTQKFLVVETEVGNISRQEAVSMIPPLFLDVQPHHFVMDMCAAPGSKTAQLIEALHSGGAEPTGVVVANDSDYKRSHMLVHQVKRLNSPNFVIVNHDAQLFPKMKLTEDGDYIKFDRILCDVPCTGDGTMRKNLTVWKDWRIGNALGLHPLQLNILMRGLQLLKKGGRLVYSTCSLSPIENEAVIAAALRRWGGKVKTVDCSDMLVGLKRRPGVSSWKTFGKDWEEKTKETDTNSLPNGVFSPTEEEAKEFHLENCMRVYPHDQNTGGFFITVLEKVDPDEELREDEEPASKKMKLETKTENAESAVLAPVKKERLPRDANEEPFVFLPPDNEELQKCWDFYQVKESFSKDTMLVRNATGEALRTIYYVAPVVKKIIETNERKLKLIYAGVKMFISQRAEYSQQACPWRVQYESVPILKEHLGPNRTFQINLDLLKILLSEPFPNVNKLREDKVDPEFMQEITDFPEGCFFVEVNRGEDKEELFLPLWKGRSNFNLMVNKHETHELLYRLFGLEN
ncbi:hypothetical protein OGAPHI_001645 [Ogataea philodendri]|uniref:SAM-dependent MTase RsmB/NOP-type domain-containing protein n=1 Tax=Ogataea philodendri TaxID=1378263 RepID=A0A9P8T816_9ASCO|nr:uncharacterized protein OGAPHI_001645 [Ogataea philodendri]KAH3669049.1 hypothetical protein OGAPHI_001645 [Ogataea philodendri]